MRFEGIFACPAGDIPNTFLVDCNSVGYGDYDHGAFWFGLEPDAALAAREADVLFLGSSRMQFGLSTAATISWFSSPPTSFYLLGFSHTENIAFVGPLLEKIQPQAKVYVINVDRFFSDVQTLPAGELLKVANSVNDYSEKKFWQRVQEPVCRMLPMACGNSVAIFRNRETGLWRIKGSVPAKSAVVNDATPTDQGRWGQFVSAGELFVSQLPVDRQCVILTLVPSEGTRRAEAQAVAAGLGMELVAPEVEGLKTFDGSHLEPSSAERWSAAFFSAAGPQIRRCL
jgi:hypothetical protein